MSRIMFRQKTPEEIAADAAGKQAREAGTARIEQQPSAAVPPATADKAASPAVAADEDGFALEPDTDAPKAKKGRSR